MNFLTYCFPYAVATFTFQVDFQQILDESSAYFCLYNSNMCGIFGAYGNRDLVRTIDPIEQLELISHRGPDANGIWKSDYCILGHTLLAIQDPGNSRQPMISRSGRFVISYNGEIYNFKELIKSKGLSALKSQSDTEVLVELIDRYGFGVVADLEGMFAFAILDTQTKVLTLGRDRFGEKPIFYAVAREGLLFGSNPIAVARMANAQLDINSQQLLHYFKYQYLPEGTSPFRSVVQLQPGYLLHFGANLKSVTKKIYREIQPSNSNFKDVFSDSVKKCVVSDVPIGLALSGGIDSTITLATMSKFTSAIDTFTVVMDEWSADNSYAKKASSIFGTTHHEIVLEDEFLAPTIFEVLTKQTLPFGDSSIVPTYLLAREAKKRVKVLLSGDGADEVLSGYDYYRKYGATMRTDFRGYLEVSKLKFEILLRQVLNKQDHDRIRRLKEWEFKLAIKSPRELWNDDLSTVSDRQLSKLFEHEQKTVKLSREKLVDFSGVQTVMDWDRLTYLPGDILWKSDSAGMMASLEIRTPFFNSNILSWAKSIEFTNIQSKQSVMKDNFVDEIPIEFFSRKKSGFGGPLSRWFSNVEVHTLLMDFVGNKRNRVFDYIDFKGITSLAKKDCQVRWNLLSLAVWLETNG